MANYIHTVTALTKDGKDSRCFGFFFDFKMAESAVKTNAGSMEECLYDYIVIEKQRWGIHAMAAQVQWYKWVGKHSMEEENGKWVECRRPDSVSPCICNWNGVG